MASGRTAPSATVPMKASNRGARFSAPIHSSLSAISASTAIRLRWPTTQARNAHSTIRSVVGRPWTSSGFCSGHIAASFWLFIARVGAVNIGRVERPLHLVPDRTGDDQRPCRQRGGGGRLLEAGPFAQDSDARHAIGQRQAKRDQQQLGQE